MKTAVIHDYYMCRKTKTKVITLANDKGQTKQWTNQNSK